MTVSNLFWPASVCPYVALLEGLTDLTRKQKTVPVKEGSCARADFQASLSELA
jgi:hypothetical protein